MFHPRLIRAEILKLGRRRGMLAIALLGTLGFVALAYGVTALQHAADPATKGPAGGTASYRDAIPTVELLVLIMGSIIGATAGTQDLESGVFRDLAATGRSRAALFGARMTGACAITLPITALAAAAMAAGAFAFADGVGTPPAHVVAAATAALLASAVLSTAAGVGLGALSGARGPVIGMLLAFFLALQPLLSAITLLGDARALVPGQALARIGGVEGTGVHPGLGLAIVVVLLWIGATLGAGARRTCRREI